MVFFAVVKRKNVKYDYNNMKIYFNLKILAFYFYICT